MSENNTNHYSTAGWLAIISAVLFMPELILAILAEFFTPELKIIVIPIHIVNVIIGVYILYMFRSFSISIKSTFSLPFSS